MSGWVLFLAASSGALVFVALEGVLWCWRRGVALKAKPTAYLPCQCTVDPASLLDRQEGSLLCDEVLASVRGRILLVTGAAGSIGAELCKQLLNYDPALLIALDCNETGLFDLAEGLRSHRNAVRLHLYIGDITERVGMDRLFNERRPELIFHAAAYKHVPLLEYYPNQAVRTNVLATYVLCCLAQQYRAKHFVFISSDKAAEPISILGASKRVGEMIVQSLEYAGSEMTRFSAVRFGNVIGSRGSVVPVFARQIMNGGPVTVTDPKATRYFMTIPEACRLVVLTPFLADKGGLYILNMGEPMRIIDLAEKMIRAHKQRFNRSIPIIYTGLRPGERLHEPLVSADEALYPTHHDQIYVVVQDCEPLERATLAAWMERLQAGLLYQNDERLRTYLFDMVQSHTLVAVGKEPS